ncbi:E3 ubiquitin-protein ligase TRIM39-like [Carcharodon carcharias]|uniref:E3 ubiquitin-protein ligase TRIM39-like n=1 Tax=Carcharodon carcharias TaxID=13397 RepID=UPI001B7DBCB3|nr:E3 ubiquitin-protein ligase TRIM39-like [Carcharodon carcharias]
MASEKELENLINEAICSICLEFYTEPMMLDCGHNFCKACILNYWDKNKESISCPKCREHFSQRNVRLNRFAANMVESVRKLSAKPREGGGALLCDQHDEKLKLFCENDKTAICVVCAVSREHKDHRISPLKDAAEVYKGKLQTALDLLNKQADEISNSQSNQQANIAELKKQAETMRKNIEAEFAKLRQYLRDEEKVLMGKIKKKEDSILQQLEENLKTVISEKALMNERIVDIQQRMSLKDAEILKEGCQGPRDGVEEIYQNSTRDEGLQLCRESGESGVVLLKNRGDLTEAFKTMNGFHKNTTETLYPKATETNFNLSLYEPIGPLQYIVWKRMLKVISPALLTLDPQTAHPRLLLTDDDTQVKRGEWKKVPEFPERFSFLLGVLATQGFTSGRHYWEVDVGDNGAWDVGAAKASVARKAIPEDGVWAVGLWDKEYTAFTNPRTALKLGSMVPKRVGVYLDYEGGQVSFYNAHNMAHIYTFTETFTEAVYPYLSTESRTDPLKLVALQLEF